MKYNLYLIKYTFMDIEFIKITFYTMNNIAIEFWPKKN